MTDREKDMIIEGLYVSLLADGTIKKHLSTKARDVYFDDTTIGEELISFSERDYIFMPMYRKGICMIACGSRSKDFTYLNAITEANRFFSKVKEYDLICGTLARIEFFDRLRGYHISSNPELMPIVDATMYLGSIFDAHADVCHGLKMLSNGASEEQVLLELSDYRTRYLPMITLNDGSEDVHIFRSEGQYYLFLFRQFLASKTRVAKCQYCGRFFIPKTKRKTLYCDRIIRDGKTCKQIAPHLNRKERAAADKVVSEYNRVKDMLVHRLERSEYDKKSSPIDLTREEYYRWLDAATAARDRYLTGEQSEEEAWKIIHVPTIQEQKQSGLVTAT